MRRRFDVDTTLCAYWEIKITIYEDISLFLSLGFESRILLLMDAGHTRSQCLCGTLVQ